MNRNELVKEVEKVLSTPSASGAVVDCVFSNIFEAMKRRDEVRLPGFGAFKVKKRNARTGVNPRTGEKIVIGEKSVPAFVPSKALKAAIDL